MKRQSFQKKRRPTGGGLFVFHSKTRPRRRKKQRVAAGSAGADLGSEVPNLGVARALFVILVLHVAAIAAIFIHNRVTDKDAAGVAAEVEPSSAAIGGQSREQLPVIQKGEDFYFVATGDTYERIAQLKGVDVDALRDLNNNMKLRAGRILRVPAAGVSAPPVPGIAEIVESDPDPDSPPPPVPGTPVRVAPVASPLVTTNEISGSGELPPIVVHRTTPAPAIRLVSDSVSTPAADSSGQNPPEPPVSASGQTYTVKSGDTVWGISQRHKVSVDGLLKANGITDARKLRPGMKLTIPAN